MIDYNKEETLKVEQNNNMMQLYFNLLYVPIYDVTSAFVTSYRNLWKSWTRKLTSKQSVSPDSN